MTPENSIMESTKFKIGLTSAVALGCAGLTYLILRMRENQKAVNAFKYLNIEIIVSDDHCNAVVKELRRRCTKHKALGFDCEWVTENGRRQPVALVQLSSLDGYCGLFRLSKIGHVPQSLKDLLEDENIYKVGVAPAGDAKYLAQDYSVFLSSSLDIRHLVVLCGREPSGLGELAKTQLGVILDKSWRIRCSNWADDELTPRQVQYAAADAHVAIKIFVKLINLYCNNGFLSRLYRRESKDWSHVHEICSDYADVMFKSKQTVKKSDLVKEKEWKETAISKRYSNLTRSKPLYHNCFLQAPDGELLCTCDTAKARWYVEKNLAVVVSEEPLTVRLKFEPAGRSVGDVGRYYQLTKENKCVVCGSQNSYIRKNVVPREYRKYFPDIMKEHSSHDVLLLCVGCHQRSNVLDHSVRERLARLCRAPVSTRDRGRILEDVDCKKVRSAARALLFQSKKHELPQARRKELENIVMQHFPEHSELTDELLLEASNMQVAFENLDFESHGYKVVQHFIENKGLLCLEKMWRVHFLESMKPKYMPELWSLDHNEERLRVRYNEGRLSEEDSKILGIFK